MEPDTADQTEDTRDAEFDRFAREASASLRRSSPASGAEAIARIGERRRTTQRLLGVTGAIVVAIAGLTVTRAATRNDTDDTAPPAVTTAERPETSTPSTAPAQTTVATSPSTTTSEASARPGVAQSPLSDVPAVQSPQEAGFEEFDLPPTAKQLATDGTTLWILHGGGPISRRDAITGADLGPITEIPLTFTVERPEVAFGSLWVTTASTDTLWRVDAATGGTTSIKIPGDVSVQVETFEHPEASNVTASEDAIWVLTKGDEPQFVQIDPRTNAVVRQIPAPARAWTVRYGFGSLWAVNGEAMGTSEPLVRVDPSDGRQLASIPSVGITDLGFGFGSVWTAELIGNQETWTRYDPSTNQRVADILYPNGGILQTDFAFAGGHVWANEGGAGLAKIDPATNRIVARYLEASGGGGTAATESVVWFANGNLSKLYRVPLG